MTATSSAIHPSRSVPRASVRVEVRLKGVDWIAVHECYNVRGKTVPCLHGIDAILYEENGISGLDKPEAGFHGTGFKRRFIDSMQHGDILMVNDDILLFHQPANLG